MSASFLLLCLLACIPQVFGDGQVFSRSPGAEAVFLRSKRANRFLVEEILQGNLERECYEELCSYEEAREVFEDTEKAISFWTVYYDGNQCDSSPCLNGGNCTDKVGGFSCACEAPYHGLTCEHGGLRTENKYKSRGQELPVHRITAPEISECPTGGPTACHQLCEVSGRSFICSCTTGFKLQSDGRSCVPDVTFPCGRLPDATRPVCPHGHCPWQVTLMSSKGVELCGGVALGQHSILIPARCLFLQSNSEMRASDFYVVAGNRKIPIEDFDLQDSFHARHHDNNLALLKLSRPLLFGPTLIHLCLPTKDFSENILMHPGRTGNFQTRQGNQEEQLAYMTLDECRKRLNATHPLTNKMFCMVEPSTARGQREEIRDSRPPRVENSTQDGLQTVGLNQTQIKAGENMTRRSEGGARLCGSLLQGSPVATVEKGTAFLTGLLLSSSADCEGQVFIKVSRYLNWISNRLKATENHMDSQFYLDPSDL
ncbi:hypothetical protein OJAV_G00013850 [Oryzias javanicus]|uniref:Uncharacterized protein n=1 Tax=Oryzias javanicus TaxID=123683 RepID=A0A3S2MG27_ORYJA|nr:hypothetical protein OJAV_G00013850 [Oryzias javanicus]